MIYIYQIEQDACYVHLHMNQCFGRLNKNIQLNSNELIDSGLLTKYISDLIISELKKTAFKYYVIDCENIYMYDKHPFEEWKNEVNKNEYIFINCNFQIAGVICEDTVCEKLVSDLHNKILCSNNGKEFINNLLGDKGIKEIKQKIIAEFVANDCAIDEIYYLSSSNVYANMYINLKSLYTSPRILNLTIYELYKIIKLINKNYNGLVCASSNGAIICTLLADLLNTESIYLLNIGPYFALRDTNELNKIKDGGNYIFIYDFMCLGNEEKIVRTICALKSATITSSLGIAKFVDSERNEKRQAESTALVDFVKFNTVLNYKVAATKDDLNKMIAATKDNLKK